MKRKVILVLVLVLALTFLFGCQPPIDDPVDDPPIDNPPVDDPPIDNPPVDDPPVDDPPQEPSQMKEYVFEAEWSESIEFLSGFDYSGTVSGLDMIQKDYYKKGASNGYFVHGLYGEGLELEYVIESDRDVDNATFVFRISAEYTDIVLSAGTYRISVNGADIAYKNIKLTNVPVHDRANFLDFADFTLTTSLSLQKGTNVVKLITANSNPMVGTMYATAPLVDCFKITTDAVLTWNPARSNTGQD